MSTIKSSDEHLTLNADGSSKDIKFQANGVQKASISSAGAFTSTTIDATALTGALPAIDGSSLTGTGKVLQVVNGTTTTTVTSSANAWVDSGLSVSITPSSTSSKILVFVSQPMEGSRADNEADAMGKLQSNHSGSYVDIQTVVQNVRLMNTYQNGTFSGTRTNQIFNFNILFSPSTTSSFTVKTIMRFNAAYGSLGDVTAQLGGHQSHITLMEIGA